jgi:hypothetical protein
MTIRLNPDVAFRRVGDELVLVNLRTNEIFALNPTAARLWELLSGGRDRASAEVVLLEEFEISQEQLRTEVDSFLSILKHEGLLSE